MRFPWANLILLILVVVQGISGYFGFTNGFSEDRWLLWLHGMGGGALVIVLFWKARIIFDVYRRGLGFDFRRLGFLVLAFGLVGTILTGYLWTYYGPIDLGGISLVTVHILLAVGVLVLFGWHSWGMRYILRHPASRGRSMLLRVGASWVGGTALWWAGDTARRRLPLPGAHRRFTGSYLTGGPGQFPAYIWIADQPEPVSLDTWHLTIAGEVARPLHLSYHDFKALAHLDLEAVLDCTGGWYTFQTWQGVPVGDILDLVGGVGQGRSITFKSVTGYDRRFAIQEAADFLLADGVAGHPLDHGHGFPVRLVAPGRRGFHWVKWVTGITVNATGSFWQPPLPLQ
jgi:hypothetical protein